MSILKTVCSEAQMKLHGVHCLTLNFSYFFGNSLSKNERDSADNGAFRYLITCIKNRRSKHKAVY